MSFNAQHVIYCISIINLFERCCYPFLYLRISLIFNSTFHISFLSRLNMIIVLEPDCLQNYSSISSCFLEMCIVYNCLSSLMHLMYRQQDPLPFNTSCACCFCVQRIALNHIFSYLNTVLPHGALSHHRHGFVRRWLVSIFLHSFSGFTLYLLILDHRV